MNALLIAHDSTNIAILSFILQRVGLAVKVTKTLAQAIKNWTEQPADIIILALPETTQEEFIKQIRAETPIPVVVFINQPDDLLHCNLLQQGADLVIPFSMNIKLMIAQISVLMRRVNTIPTMSLPTLKVAGLTLDPTNRTVTIANKPVQRLTQLEFRLLYTLMVNRGQVIPTETIVERVWGYTGQGDRDLVRGLISRLRSKIETDPQNPRYILTFPNLGYSFSADLPGS